MATNLKIVMVDDNTDFLFTMETFLQRNGFEVRTAEDGQKGIDLILRIFLSWVLYRSHHSAKHNSIPNQ